MITDAARRALSGFAIAACCLGPLAVTGCGGGGESDGTSSEISTRHAEARAKAKRIAALEQKLRDQGNYTANGPVSPTVDSEDESPPKPQGGKPGGSGGLGDIDALGDEIGAEVGVAVGPPGSAGPTAVAGSLTTGSAWSTIKVAIALRVLEDAGGPGGISSAQQDLIDRAITLSDNDAAAQLFDGLERTHGGLAGASDAVTQELRAAGDETTVVSTQGRDSFSTYGQTEWSLSEQERFMAALAGGCLSSSATRAFLLEKMGRVTSDTWGLGSAGVSAKWKGGWGPGVDGRYLLRQMGVLGIGGKDVVVTLAVMPDDGQFTTGQSDASAVAEWVAKRAGGVVGGPAGC